MATYLHLDFETKSTVDLKSSGADVYARHPSTDILCLGYQFDDGEISIWIPNTPFPKEIINHIQENKKVVAHNAVFEFLIWNNILHARHDLPELKAEQLICTMAMSYAMALPGSLENAAPAAGLSSVKDMTGKRIMLKLSQPRKIYPDGTVTWFTEQLPELYEYCKQDVKVEGELFKRLLRLDPKEQKVFELDIKINQRGIKIDLDSAKYALELITLEQARLNKEIQKVSHNMIGTCNAVSQFMDFLALYKIKTEGVTKSEVEELLTTELPEPVRKALLLRQEAAKSSTAKVKAMINGVCEDGRVRGVLQYHGASTGRWSGRKIQTQNLPRSTMDNESIEQVFNLLKAKGNHADTLETITMLYGSPLQVISNCLRGLIIPEEENEFICADFSAIEARVLAWLAGEEKVLEVFRTHGKLYEATASGIYSKPIENVTKDERQIGKVACIAEGSPVLTDKGLVPIEKISLAHKLWDGIEWVSHDGVVFKGEKEVIEYEGLKATKDHIVWSEDGRQVLFGHCAREQIPIAKTGFGRQAIRMGENNITENKMAWRERQTRVQKQIQIFKSSMYRMFDRKVYKYGQFIERKIKRLSEMFSTQIGPEVALQTSNSHEVKMRKHERSELSKLWRKRNTFRFRQFIGRSTLDTKQFRASQTFRNRSDKQQWELRSRKFKICNSLGKREKPTPIKNKNGRSGVGERIKPFFFAYYRKIFKKRISERSNSRFSFQSDFRQKKKLEGDKKETRIVRVYDIVNAGPRNRFTVSNCLVHNCLALGYQGGKGAFKIMAKNYGVVVDDNRADQIKIAWRESHRNIVRYWYDLESAAIRAIANPNTKYSAGYKGREVYFKKIGSFLLCLLPSKRALCYPYPKIEQHEMPWGDLKDCITYMGEDTYTRKWERLKTYGGKLCENITQAVSRDILSDAIIRLEENNYPTVFHVHDEIVCEVKKGLGSLKEMEKLMSVVPDWASGLPLSAEGWIGNRYRK